MSESFCYSLNPAYCLYRGVAIEKQNGSNISFCVSDSKNCKAMKKGFYDYVDYVRTLNECPPEYNKKTVVRFKHKNRVEIERMISYQLLKVYTADQCRILEEMFNDCWGLVVISSGESFQNYNDFLHLKFLENPNSYFEKDYWSVNGKERIKQKLEEGKLVFIEMTKISTAEIVNELLYGNVLSEKMILDYLKCVIMQEGHSFSGNRDLLVDIAVLKKKLTNKKLMELSDDEKDNCFVHYTNFGEVLHNGMDRLFKRRNFWNKNKVSAYSPLFCLITACFLLFSGCNLQTKLKNADISAGFVKNCISDKTDLNQWQKFFRKKWNLGYIAWTEASAFLVETDMADNPLYYGCWSFDKQERKINGEIYCRSNKIIRSDITRVRKNQRNYMVPYEIHGDLEYEISDISFDYEFSNKTEKPVKSYTIVFYLFDEDGNPPENVRNNIVVEEKNEVGAYSSISEKINLERYFEILPEEKYTVDFLYVSKIEFTDSSEWRDPFGMKYL